MHTETATKCPFCRTEYDDAAPTLRSGPEDNKEKPKEKKGAKKTRKESFKIW